MIAIFDRQSETQRLPLAELLDAILRHSSLKLDDEIALTRMGGTGQKVWLLESRLDAGETVRTSIGELKSILSGTDQIVDELRCSYRNFGFGLIDSTYLFVHATDKEIENGVASEFQRVTVLAGGGDAGSGTEKGDAIL